MAVSILRREFIIGDLVTIAPDFRNTITDFDFEKYIGIVINIPEQNEYVVYWTNSPTVQTVHHRGLWSGDHLVRIEDYEAHRRLRKTLHISEI